MKDGCIGRLHVHCVLLSPLLRTGLSAKLISIYTDQHLREGVGKASLMLPGCKVASI